MGSDKIEYLKDTCEKPQAETSRTVTPEEEILIISAILGGESEKFHDLVRPYEGGVYAMALALLKNRADAEDAAQDTFLKAYRNLSCFRGDARFSTWLYSIALNEARARLRKYAAVRLESIDLGPNDRGYVRRLLPDPSETPVEIIERLEKHALLAQAIDTLPAIYREVFHLREEKGLSVRETAQALAITGEAVKVRLYRARAVLRDYLTPYLGRSGSNRRWNASLSKSMVASTPSS
jgi:RNA polymerase sigma-70 factor (ECF subfamily)